MAGECQVRVLQILAVLLCVIGNIPVNADTNRRNCVGVGISEHMSTFHQITENESITVSCELITNSGCNAAYRRFWLIQSKRKETSIDIIHLADSNTHIEDNPYHAMDIQMNNFTLTLQGLTANLEYILLHCGAQEMDTDDEHEVLARDVIFIEIMLPTPSVTSTAPPVTCIAPIISSPVQATMETTPGLVKGVSGHMTKCQKNIVIIGAVFSVAAVIIVVLLGLLILMWIKRRKIVIASTVETTECDKTPKTEEEKGRT